MVSLHRGEAHRAATDFDRTELVITVEMNAGQVYSADAEMAGRRGLRRSTGNRLDLFQLDEMGPIPIIEWQER